MAKSERTIALLVKIIEEFGTGHGEEWKCAWYGDGYCRWY